MCTGRRRVRSGAQGGSPGRRRETSNGAGQHTKCHRTLTSAPPGREVGDLCCVVRRVHDSRGGQRGGGCGGSCAAQSGRRMTSAARGRVSVIHIPFGKYRGRPITEIDDGYLHWLHEKLDEWQPALREAIVAERSRRRGVPSSDPEPAQTALVPLPSPRHSAQREHAAPSAVCARCGLGASVTRPLVHASCVNDEVPF